MAKKIRRNKIIKANKIFTDRELPRDVFHEEYKGLSEAIKNQEESDPKIITYYGIGGIGKSTLLKQLQIEMKEKYQNHKYALIDLEHTQNPVEILEKLRNKLNTEYQVQFPIFDIALYVYKTKRGEKIEIDTEDNAFEANAFLSSIVDIAASIPLVGSVASTIVPISNVITEVKNRKTHRAVELFEIENTDESAEDLLKLLPEIFSNDLAEYTEILKEPLVLFLDTYEKLVNEQSSIGEPLNADLWLRGDLGLVLLIPNVLWVIAGREKIKWDTIDTDWKDNLNQHLLGELSEQDAFMFLDHAGIKDAKLQKEIYKVTHGTPVYLDICVDNYFALISQQKTPTIDEIGNTYQRLIQSFIKYANDDLKDLLFVVSLINSWDESYLGDLATDVIGNVAFTTISKLKDYSFISTDDNITYKMHEIVKKELALACPEIILTKTCVYHKAYLKKAYDDSNNYDFKMTLLKQQLDFIEIVLKAEGEIIDYFNRYIRASIFELKDHFPYVEFLPMYENLVRLYKNKKISNRAGINIFPVFHYLMLRILDVEIDKIEELIDYFKSIVKTIKEKWLRQLIILNHLYLHLEYRKTSTIEERLLYYYESYFVKQRYDFSAVEPLQRVIDLGYFNMMSYHFIETNKYESALQIDAFLYENRHYFNHLDQNKIIRSYTFVLRRSGYIDEAESILNDEVKYLEELYGANHKSVITTQLRRCGLHLDKFEYDQALELAEKLLDQCISTFGEEHSYTVNVYKMLSIIHGNRNDYVNSYNAYLKYYLYVANRYKDTSKIVINTVKQLLKRAVKGGFIVNFENLTSALINVYTKKGFESHYSQIRICLNDYISNCYGYKGFDKTFYEEVLANTAQYFTENSNEYLDIKIIGRYLQKDETTYLEGLYSKKLSLNGESYKNKICLRELLEQYSFTLNASKRNNTLKEETNAVLLSKAKRLTWSYLDLLLKEYDYTGIMVIRVHNFDDSFNTRFEQLVDSSYEHLDESQFTLKERVAIRWAYGRYLERKKKDYIKILDSFLIDKDYMDQLSITNQRQIYIDRERYYNEQDDFNMYILVAIELYEFIKKYFYRFNDSSKQIKSCARYINIALSRADNVEEQVLWAEKLYNDAAILMGNYHYITLWLYVRWCGFSSRINEVKGKTLFKAYGPMIEHVDINSLIYRREFKSVFTRYLLDMIKYDDKPYKMDWIENIIKNKPDIDPYYLCIVKMTYASILKWNGDSSQTVLDEAQMIINQPNRFSKEDYTAVKKMIKSYEEIESNE